MAHLYSRQRLPRVLHSPVNIAGGPGALSTGLRRLGCDSTMLVFNERPFVRGYDRILNLHTGRGRWDLPRNLPKQFRALAWALPRFDIFHFHFGLTLVPRRINLPLLRALGKPVVFQYWGSDIRDRPASAVDYLRHADAAVLGSYFALAHAPRGDWTYDIVPPAIDLSEWRAAVPDPGATLRIAHAPSKRAVKGTQAVLDAVSSLKAAGAKIELDLIENTPHAEARKRYAEADIIVDQLRVGWYGVFAIESMALGKPVICHVEPEPAARTGEEFGIDLPIVRATEQTIGEQLATLVADPERIKAIGAAGRQYVERVHEQRQVAQRMLDIYRRCMRGGAASDVQPQHTSRR